MDTNILEELAAFIVRVEVCRYKNWLSELATYLLKGTIFLFFISQEKSSDQPGAEDSSG
jgi:hypothetical protein